MIKKELTINLSLDDVRKTFSSLERGHETEFKRLNFDNSLNVLKVWGYVNLDRINYIGVDVYFEVYFEEIEKNKVNVIIEYANDWSNHTTNEQIQTQIEQALDIIYNKFFKYNPFGKDEHNGSRLGCVILAIVFLVASMSVFYVIFALFY